MSDADLNGARMLASSGYDPIGLPTFFEKLQKKVGSTGEPQGLALWMSSHPATGSRIQSVSQDMTFYPKREYTASTGNFPHVKQLVASLPAAKPKPGFLILAKQGASPRTNLPAEFKDFQANGFAIGYPSSWAVGAPKPGSSMYIVPQGGVAQGKDGKVELLVARCSTTTRLRTGPLPSSSMPPPNSLLTIYVRVTRMCAQRTRSIRLSAVSPPS